MKTQTNTYFIPLEKYPTTRNAKIYVDNSDPLSDIYTLVSYGITPVNYIYDKYMCAAKLNINICPYDLTATTRKHIYAFIRQIIPPAQAQAIINSVRKQFSLSPNGYANGEYMTVYKMSFDVFPA